MANVKQGGQDEWRKKHTGRNGNCAAPTFTYCCSPSEPSWCIYASLHPTESQRILQSHTRGQWHSVFGRPSFGIDIVVIAIVAVFQVRSVVTYCTTFF